jgi:hypothetical protein
MRKHKTTNSSSRFVKRTLHSTQQLLVKEDPSKTTQPDFIHTLVTEHTAQLREQYLRDRATSQADFDSKDKATDDDNANKSATPGKTKRSDDEEDFATNSNFQGTQAIALFLTD